MKPWRLFLISLLSVLLLFASGPERVMAFTSLQSCYQSPACAKMLMESGMIGASTVPQGLTTAAAPIAAAGAPAASSLVIPASVAGASAGVAALFFPWGQEKADKLTESYIPPFQGGQEPGVMYQFKVQNSFAGVLQSKVTAMGGVGPISTSTEASDTFERAYVHFGNGTRNSCGGTPNASQMPVLCHIYDVERVDGQPDTGGDPSPKRNLATLPTAQEFESLFGPPQEIPFPPAQPGPDGETGTDDDIYPPLTFPGPTISPDVNGDPQYNPSDQTIPNPLASPEANPGDDTNTATGTETGTGTEPEPFPRDLFEGDLESPQAIDSASFNAPHFIPHALDVFSSKFPLDVLGSLPDPGDKVCPEFEFFSESFEFCIINDALDALKIPTLVSFVIWAVMAL